MAEIAYNYPEPRTYIYCSSKGQRRDVELCHKCPYIKGCSDYMNYIQDRESSKNEGGCDEQV